MSRDLQLQERVFAVVRNIPKGKVLTYGDVARLAGVKNPRVVGNILHRNTDPNKTPCHRVVNFQGRVAKNYGLGGAEVQAKRLQNEGVALLNQIQVDLEKARWKYC